MHASAADSMIRLQSSDRNDSPAETLGWKRWWCDVVQSSKRKEAVTLLLLASDVDCSSGRPVVLLHLEGTDDDGKDFGADKGEGEE